MPQFGIDWDGPFPLNESKTSSYSCLHLKLIFQLHTLMSVHIRSMSYVVLSESGGTVLISSSNCVVSRGQGVSGTSTTLSPLYLRTSTAYY